MFILVWGMTIILGTVMARSLYLMLAGCMPATDPSDLRLSRFRQMRPLVTRGRFKTMIVSALIGLIVYITSLCFADTLAEPAAPKPERPESLMSMIIPDEPVIAVYVAGEGLFYFRESEIRPQDR